MTMVIRSIPAKHAAGFPPPPPGSTAMIIIWSAVPSSWRNSRRLRLSPSEFCPAQPEHPPAEDSVLFNCGALCLDPSRVYNIRDLTLERGAIHITFEDGTIGFTEDVAGHVTGAFFSLGKVKFYWSPRTRLSARRLPLFARAAILE